MVLLNEHVRRVLLVTSLVYLKAAYIVEAASNESHENSAFHRNISIRDHKPVDFCGLSTSESFYSTSRALISFDEDFFQLVRKPVAVTICLFGVLANILNTVLVIRNRSMFGDISRLLASLSIAQTVLLIGFLIVTLIMPVMCDPTFRTFGFMTLLKIVGNTNVVFHSAAIIHVTILAIYRYAMIRWPMRFYGSRSANRLRVRRRSSSHGSQSSFLSNPFVILSIYAIVALVCVPFYLRTDVTKMTSKALRSCNWSRDDGPMYTLSITRFAERHRLDVVNLWLFSIVFKLVPCVIIVTLNALLLCEIRRHHQRRQRMAAVTTMPESAEKNRLVGKIIFVVVLMLFIVEATNGVMNLSVAICGGLFKNYIHKPLLDLLDLLTVLYSSVNFVLYCLMSGQYRAKLKELLFGICRARFSDGDEVKDDCSPQVLQPLVDAKYQTRIVDEIH